MGDGAQGPRLSLKRDNTPPEVRELRQYFRVMGDVLRLRLLRELAIQDEMSVSQLVAVLRVSQPLVSFHLGLLRRARLVRTRRTGRQAYYTLDREQMAHYHNLLAAFLPETHSDE
ncbi:MAG: metalloregulator ArsR/SmtB family transcription factor [Chloroflexota bacterium]